MPAPVSYPYVLAPYIDMRSGELTRDDEKLSWLAYAIQSGDAYLQNQRAWQDIDAGMDIVNGDFFDDGTGELSNVTTNRTKRQIREIVASLGNLKVVPKYKTLNRDYVSRVEVMDKLFAGFWAETHATRKWRKCLQWACGTGTGYMVPRWDENFHAPGIGDISIDIFGPRDVLPIQLPRDHDLQKAYAVLIRKETPLDLARRTWPDQADQIVADRDAPAGFRKVVTQVQRFASAILNRFAGTSYREDEQTPFPVVDIWECYILDTTVNTSGREIHLGTPGTSWSYTVPYLGQRLPGSKPGDFREADRSDALMFPLRRCMVATKNCVLSDGPNPYHHGKVPAIQMRVDDWPWNFLGYSMAREGAGLEQSNISMMRDIVDANRARLNPPFFYDTARITPEAAATINPRVFGQSIPLDLGGLANVDQVFKTVVPVTNYDVPAIIPAFIKEQEARQDYQMGVTDISAMMKAKSLPASDGLEKLMQAAGPLAEDMSGTQEDCMMRLGPFVKSLQMQFYSPRQIVSMIGWDLAAKFDEMWDGEPGNLIPSHMPGEDTTKASNFPKWKRAQWFGNEMIFNLTPYTMHRLAQNSRKLSVALLERQGVPIDPWTLCEINDLDFGPTPVGATTVWQRHIEWERLQTQDKVEQIKYIIDAAKAAGIPPEMLLGAIGGGGGKGQGKGGGRPNSFATAPTQQTKDGGTRATVRTSPR
jgi:hypothetical protein